MPTISLIDKNFLKQVLEGEKMLFKKQEVSYIHVPHYEEIAVKHLWPDLK